MSPLITFIRLHDCISYRALDAHCGGLKNVMLEPNQKMVVAGHMQKMEGPAGVGMGKNS